MTPERVNAAIAWGMSLAHRKTEDPFDAYSLGARERVNVTTPYLRVALAARRAAEDGRQFTAADVTPEMIKPVLVVYAPGNLIGPLLPPEIAGIDDYTEAVDVDALYILRADGLLIQPLSSRTSWSEFLSEEPGVLKHSNMTASFP